MITRALSDSYSTHSPVQHSLSLADKAFEFRNFHLRTNWWPLRELPTIPLHPFQRHGQTAINHSFAPSNWAQLSIYWQWELLTLGCDDFTLCQRRLWPCQRVLSFHCKCPPSKPVQTLQKKIKLKLNSSDTSSVGGRDSLGVSTLKACICSHCIHNRALVAGAGSWIYL